MTKDVKIERAKKDVWEIIQQARRRKRACDNKPYLKTDLEIIEQKAESLLNFLERPENE